MGASSGHRTAELLDRQDAQHGGTAWRHSMEADKHRLSDQVGQLQSKLQVDRAALHRDLIDLIVRCRRGVALACERHITHCYYTMLFIHPAAGAPAV